MQEMIARRAALSVPGASDKMIAMARGLEVDEIVLDLENAVRAEHKLAARERVVAALAHPEPPRCTRRSSATA
jgi:citrate lyase subunit beta/citryl-CoA lyase